GVSPYAFCFGDKPGIAVSKAAGPEEMAVHLSADGGNAVSVMDGDRWAEAEQSTVIRFSNHGPTGLFGGAVQTIVRWHGAGQQDAPPGRAAWQLGFLQKPVDIGTQAGASDLLVQVAPDGTGTLQLLE